jgi:hypothetical protein
MPSGTFANLNPMGCNPRVYASTDSLHDYFTQTKVALEDTTLGIFKLKASASRSAWCFTP